MREVRAINSSELLKTGWEEKKVLIPKTIYQRDADTLVFENGFWILNNKQKINYFEDIQLIKNSGSWPEQFL